MGDKSLKMAEPGVYASIEGKWMLLKPNQLEAFNNYKEEQGMYSMGHDPEYGTDCGVDSTGQRYNIIYALCTKKSYIQLGDGEYHEILEIPPPPVAVSIAHFQGTRGWQDYE